jgi:hypothetical protein
MQERFLTCKPPAYVIQTYAQRKTLEEKGLVTRHQKAGTGYHQTCVDDYCHRPNHINISPSIQKR